MKVIKKNGAIEELELNKITRSIENSAYDAEITLSESDLTILCNMVKKIITLKDKEYTSSFEIIGAVLYALSDSGYSIVAKKYIAPLVK